MLGGVTMRLVIPALLTLSLIGCGDERHCDLMKRQDYPSPDTRHVAVVFEMCCYDTTGFYPHVSLLRPRQKLGDNGNVLNGGPGDVFSVAWTAPRSLLVQYRPSGEWVRHPPPTTNIDGITITFQKR
jgi:hypothetical protein